MNTRDYPTYEQIHQLAANPKLAAQMLAALERDDGPAIARIAATLTLAGSGRDSQ